MKKILAEKKTPNLENLKTELPNVWCKKMFLDYFRSISDYMPKRIKLVLKNKLNMIS